MTNWNAMSDDEFRNVARKFVEDNYPQKLRYPSRRLRWAEIQGWYFTQSKAGWIAPGWPLWAIYVLFALHGFTTGAWAGAVLAEAGKLASASGGSASLALSGMFVYLNSGKLLGPLVFANIYWFTQSYAWAFASLALPAALALVWLSKNKSTKSIS